MNRTIRIIFWTPIWLVLLILDIIFKAIAYIIGNLLLRPFTKYKWDFQCYCTEWHDRDQYPIFNWFIGEWID